MPTQSEIIQQLAQTGEIEISCDPKFKYQSGVAVRRLVRKEGGLLWYACVKQAILDLKIYYLNEDGTKMTEQRYAPYSKRLMADMTGKVDQNFNYLSEQDAGYASAPTEYEAILSLAMTVPVPALCAQFIQLRDSQGYFDI
jgi:hypothetical protein